MVSVAEFLPRMLDAPTADQYVFKYMRATLKHINTRWRSRVSPPHSSLDDLVSVACEALAEAAKEYPEWSTFNGVNPYDGAAFWASARQRIDWAIMNHLDRRVHRAEPSLEVVSGQHEEDAAPWPDFVRTQLLAQSHPSVLLPQLVAALADFNAEVLVWIALYYFEELPGRKVAEITSTPETTMQRHLKSAADQLRQIALQLTLDDYLAIAPPTGERRAWHAHPASVVEWTQLHYGVDPDRYVAYVLAHFKADVSYAVDILDVAAGKIAKHQANNRIADAPCTVDGCERWAKVSGMCNYHWRRRPEAPRCERPDCDRARKAWGLCSTHYTAERRRREVAEILA